MLKRFKWVLLFSFVSLQTCFGQASANTKFSASDVRYDFKYLYQTLQKTHYNLFAKTSRRAYDREFNRLYRTIEDSLTPLQVNRLFQPFAALAGMGHCQIGYPFKSYNVYLDTGGRIFPFDVRIEQRRMYVTFNHSKDSTIRQGDEILAIYGVPTTHWLDRIYKYLSGENEYYKNTLIDLVGFPRLFWMVYDKQALFSIKIRKANGQIVFVNDEGILASVYRQIRNSRPPLFHIEREFRFVGDIAYLRPGQFVNATANGNTSTQQTFEKGEFVRFIDSAFVKIHQQKARQLLIDLRGNPGGDNSFSDYMLAYFASKPFSFNSSYSVRTSAITKQFWQQVTNPSLVELKRNILNRPNGEIFTIQSPLQPIRQDSLRFTGSVFVLIDRYTYSNAATLAAQIQDYQFGRLLGEQTAESPTLYASVHEFELPRTKLSVTYPKAFMVRPNGDKSHRGVIPDVAIPSAGMISSDSLLELTIRYLHKNKG